MTLLAYIFALVIGAAALEFILSLRYQGIGDEANVRMQNTVYYVTLFGVWFLFVIRYYYGPDIQTYVPLYDQLHPWRWYLSHPDHYEYEHGFILFCALLKGWGVSYYQLTAIITTLYFVAVALFFQRIPRRRTLALMILVLYDYAMIVAMHRQCLSVSFFLLMVMLMDRRKYLWALLCALLTVEMHKSGIFVVGLTWFFFLIHRHEMDRRFLLLCFGLLCLLLVVPLSAVSSSFLHALPLPQSFIESLELHLTMGRQVQVIWIIYAGCILLLEYALQHRSETVRGTEAAVLVGVVFLVAFYHYFYLLERLRSYFLPIVLAYLFRTVQEAEDNDAELMNGTVRLAKTAFVAFLFLYFGLRAVNFERGVQQYHSRLHTPGGKTIYTPCTVFDLRHHTPEYLRSERMCIAEKYWWYDFMQREKYKITDVKIKR